MSDFTVVNDTNPLYAEIERLKRERDALADALREIAEWRMHSGAFAYSKCEDYGDQYYLIESEVFKAKDIARAAIAQVRK